jgi:GDPmannose 4,6-dehydratase
MARKKRALITGITGQDGSYLAELLVEKGYEVYGLIRRCSTEPLLRIGGIVFGGKVKLLDGNVRDINTIRSAMEIARPDEVYNLAALSDVGISFKCPDETFDINYHGLGRIVKEAVRVNPKVRIYQASTSEMFGRTKPPQSEQSLFRPQSPYAEAKLKAHEDFVVGYRKKHGTFICSGILFNHESPRRGKHFVTRKITHSLAKVKHGLQSCVKLGNLDAQRDWGFAGDYVKAMWLMLQQPTPVDLVIATGKSYSVRDFVNATAKALGMPIHWKGKGLHEVGLDDEQRIVVSVSKKYYRPREVQALCGDARKAKKVLGWSPVTTFDDLVKMMVKSDERDIRFEKKFMEFI